MINNSFSFAKDGFVIIRNCISKQLLENFEGSVRRLAQKLCNNSTSYKEASITDILAFIEKENKASFKSLLGFLGSTTSAFQIAVSEKLLSELKLCVGETSLAPSVPGLFFNSPLAKQLQYEWHQERAYYPDRPNVITAWIPVFRDVRRENGPMLIARNSHTKDYPYKIEFRENGLMQLAVDQKIAEKFEVISCEVALGDVIIFHAGALHRTSHNSSNSPRINLICRYYPLSWGQSPPICNASSPARDEYIKRAINSAEFS